jgi:integrase
MRAPKLVKRSKSYAIEWYDPQKGFTTRRSLGTDDAGTARRIYAEYLLKTESFETRTVEGLLASFYAKKAQNYPSRYVYKTTIQYASKYLKDLDISDFKLKKQEFFVEKLREEGLAEGTIKRMMAAVATSVKYAFDREEITSKPPILTIQDDTRRERVLTDDEARAIIRASTGTPAQRYIEVALMTGARPSAIVGLHRSQFDFDHHLLRLLPPGERQVRQKPKPTIALPRTLESIAKTWEDGRVVKMDHHRPLWEYVKSVVPGACAYDIRHTVATELVRQGVPEWDISGYLGHQGPGARTTQRYVHYSPQFMRAAADAMDRYWNRLTGGTNEGDTGVNGGSSGGERKDADETERAA